MKANGSSGDRRAPAVARPSSGLSSRTAGPRTAGTKAFFRRLKLRHLLFLLLLSSGIIPLLISSFRLIQDNEETLKTQEKVRLTNAAQALANALSDHLARSQDRLRFLGRALVADPDFAILAERLQEPWVSDFFRGFAAEDSGVQTLFAVDQHQIGLSYEPRPLPVPVAEAMSTAFSEALASRAPVYRFISHSGDGDEPTAAVAVPIAIAGSEETLVVQALVQLPVWRLTTRSDTGREELLLIDRSGSLLWSAGFRPQVERALLQSDLVADFTQMPLSIIQEHDLAVGDEILPTLVQIVPVQETGWGVVAHRPADTAFTEVEEMVWNTVLLSLLLVVLALGFALLAARWISRPIQQLATTSHEIAEGHFDRRVPIEGLGFEIAELAEDFNRMGAYVESYIERLRRAAEENRSLFISSIRAFAAAIDAKDPYTRGHSERVAAYSRSIARYLGLADEIQERVWISAVLHDVGKIGVDDQVLKKGGVLTPEEFEKMKLHPTIGADIVEPIVALHDMIPGIRWHHEAWNGTGYPDRLKGEQIPVLARIIGVADTFDAITTNRPYQQASSSEYALETIKRLTGTKFDAKIVTAFLLAWEAGHITMAREEAESITAEVALATPAFLAN